METAEIKLLEKPPSKSDDAVRQILLGWLEACVTSEITLIEISGIIDGEPRNISYATITKGDK